MSRFLIKAHSGDGRGLVDLGLEADREHHAIRAVECLAEAARVCPDAAALAAAPLEALLDRMDHRCWLAVHPAYGATLVALARARTRHPA